jgi:hypothetical protein
MQALHMQLNPDYHSKSSIQQEEDYFHHQTGTNLKINQ